MATAGQSQSMSADDRGRLDRVEEGLAFTERAVEQLSTEIADINRRVQLVTRRLALIEQRLEKPQGDQDPAANDAGDPSSSADSAG